MKLCIILRHYFANKGLYSQSYSFSSSHAWMWELDHKEGWKWKSHGCVRLFVTPWTVILQARMLEWLAFPFSSGSSQSRDQIQVSHIAGGVFTSWATREAESTESWVLENWCLCTEVLEKTTESRLEWKEIKPVDPKRNQPWIFIGRADAETEAPILWLPDEKSSFIRKDSDAGKDWRQEEKGMTEMVGWHHWLNEHEFEQTLGDGEWQGSLVCCSPWGSQRVGRDWTTEQQQMYNAYQDVVINKITLFSSVCTFLLIHLYL